ncbi:MAG: DNA mismatch repair endonuclease MutL [Clostridiaceae bacterium]|nr:DNA mismatch repair endonuclease MutL [Clostridiaceae bacterium]
MNRINILDDNTANKIAAGEVVERPFSVVKELIENSIDAKAKNIIVEIYEGGQQSIKITDDGIGVHPEDIKIAFMPHATSKISDIEDVFTINTMGFRGEALPSIASVSNTVFKSRTAEFEYGKEISILGGNLEYIKDTGCNVGSSIEVNNLFFNVPARKKFLKSPQRESALITDIVTRLALAHNRISFKLFNNGKNLVTTYASENMMDTIRFIYDKNTCENVINFEEHGDVLSVYGFIGTAELSRGSRNNQSVFVNKRYIKSKLITTAIETAFKSFLMINKFPFFIVFLDIYPEMIDVNVHPTKSEIKFKDERVIFKAVFDVVHKALRDSRINSFKEVQDDFIDVLEKKAEEEKLLQEKIEILEMPIDLKFENSPLNYKVLESSVDSVFEKKIELTTPTQTQSLERKLPSLRVVGQFHNTYIIAEAKEELFLIDQHAAHEKILFEKYRNQIKNMQVMSQLLIIPTVMELSPEDFSTYIENKELFTSTGFGIEVFGDETITIREVPIILGKPDLKNLFLNIIDNLKNMGTGLTVDVKYHKIATIACKAAIKGNDPLSQVEMVRLLEDLSYIEDPFNCPHGRPTIIKMSVNELEKKFKRIQ